MRVGMHTARLALRTAQTSDWQAEPKQEKDITGMLEPFQLKNLMEYEGHWLF
ncbi:hypothetical protein K8T06_17485 [bacterium]|nr:hypothetical protein [bacterium]